MSLNDPPINWELPSRDDFHHITSLHQLNIHLLLAGTQVDVQRLNFTASLRISVNVCTLNSTEEVRGKCESKDYLRILLLLPRVTTVASVACKDISLDKASEVLLWRGAHTHYMALMQSIEMKDLKS